MRTSRWIRYALAFLSVLGGLSGAVMVVLHMVESSEGIVASTVLLLAIAAYVFITAAGVVFWLDPKCVRPLFWAFVIQVPWISLPGFVYKLTSVYWSLALVFNHDGNKYFAGYTTDLGPGPVFEFRLFQMAPPFQIGVNLVAVLALLLLSRITRVVPAVAPEQAQSEGDSAVRQS